MSVIAYIAIYVKIPSIASWELLNYAGIKEERPKVRPTGEITAQIAFLKVIYAFQNDDNVIDFVVKDIHWMWYIMCRIDLIHVYNRTIAENNINVTNKKSFHYLNIMMWSNTSWVIKSMIKPRTQALLNFITLTVIDHLIILKEYFFSPE